VDGSRREGKRGFGWGIGPGGWGRGRCFWGKRRFQWGQRSRRLGIRRLRWGHRRREMGKRPWPRGKRPDEWGKGGFGGLTSGFSTAFRSRREPRPRPHLVYGRGEAGVWSRGEELRRGSGSRTQAAAGPRMSIRI
jgi:hypothetical protein